MCGVEQGRQKICTSDGDEVDLWKKPNLKAREARRKI